MTALSLVSDNCIVFTLLVVSCLLCYRIGVFSLAVEASFQNSACAFALYVVLSSSHGIVAGCFVALSAGLMTAALYSALIVAMGLEEIVCGIAINMLSLGASTWLSFRWAHTTNVSVGSFVQDIVSMSRTALWITASLAVAAVGYSLYFAKIGPTITAIGENSEVAQTCDIPVRRVKFWLITVSGVPAALAGVLLTLGSGGFTTVQWSLGWGYMALAIVAACRGRLFMTLIFSIVFAVFGVSETGRFTQLPNEVADGLPKVLLIVLFCILGYRRRKNRLKVQRPTSGVAKATSAVSS